MTCNRLLSFCVRSAVVLGFLMGFFEGFCLFLSVCLVRVFSVVAFCCVVLVIVLWLAHAWLRFGRKMVGWLVGSTRWILDGNLEGVTP